MHLVNGADRIAEILEGGHAHDAIERAIRERHGRRIPLLHGDMDAGVGRILSGDPDEGSADVHRRHGVAAPRQLDGEIAWARCHLQDATSRRYSCGERASRVLEPTLIAGGVLRVPRRHRAFHRKPFVRFLSGQHCNSSLFLSNDNTVLLLLTLLAYVPTRSESSERATMPRLSFDESRPLPFFRTTQKTPAARSTVDRPDGARAAGRGRPRRT